MDEEQKPHIATRTILIYSIIAVVVVGLGVGLYFLVGNRSNESDSSSTTSDSKFSQYDGKVVNISSSDGKVEGQLAIAIDESETYPINVVYFMKVDQAFPKTETATEDMGPGYNYVYSHGLKDNIRQGSEGALSEVLCNPEAKPDVLSLTRARSIDEDTYLGCDVQTDPWHVTTAFYLIYSAYFNSETFNYENIISNDTLAIFDGGPFFTNDEETGGWGYDDDEVVETGKIVAEYRLIYTE